MSRFAARGIPRSLSHSWLRVNAVHQFQKKLTHRTCWMAVTEVLKRSRGPDRELLDSFGQP